MQKLLIIGSVHEQGLALAKVRDDINLAVLDDEFGHASDDFGGQLADAEAILVRTARLSRDAIAAATQLRVVSKHGVGYDNIDLAALNERGIPLTVTADANAVSVAEHTLYLLLALARRGIAYDRATRAGDFAFRNSLQAVDLAHKQLLLLGFGRIGRRVAQRCLAFEMAVSVYDPYIDPSLIRSSGCQPVDDLNAALAVADVLSLHFPGGGDNRQFVNRQRLQALKPGALLINAARGDLIDQQALCELLADGYLGGAGLDVFAEEPLSSDHPLCAMDNVLLSPHSAATSQEGAINMALSAVQNALDGLDHRLSPTMVVNRDVL